MRSFLVVSSLSVALFASFVFACSSDSSTGSSATGSSSSGSGATGTLCYLNTAYTKCECVPAATEKPAAEWTKVLNCSSDTLDYPTSCATSGDTCSCDVYVCQVKTGDTCACGTNIAAGVEKSEQTTCLDFDWCCEKEDGSGCHCGKGTAACGTGEKASATATCALAQLKPAPGKTATCGK